MAPIFFLLLTSIGQQQVVQMAQFNRCEWETEIIDAIKKELPIHRNGVVQFFRNRPDYDCIIKIQYFQESDPKYYYYKKGRKISQIENSLILTRNIAFLEFAKLTYSFEGGYTAAPMF